MCSHDHLDLNRCGQSGRISRDRRQDLVNPARSAGSKWAARHLCLVSRIRSGILLRCTAVDFLASDSRTYSGTIGAAKPLGLVTSLSYS